MPYPQLNRIEVRMKPLAERENKKYIERDHVTVDQTPAPLSEVTRKTLAEGIARIHEAHRQNKPVMLATGAHTIKNGLSPVLIKLVEEGWVTHLAANGAGIIHDWEFAYQGMTSEDVRQGVSRGEFGNWQETGFFINLALNVGAFEGKGYGESVGAMIETEGLTIPSPEELEHEIVTGLKTDAAHSAAAADLLDIVRKFKLAPGRLEIPHPFKRFSIQAAAYRLGVPFTGHPMIGHDIIYNHPMNNGAALGRVAQRDFLTFAESVSRIEDGVYMSVGSAVMSPMIFEKSLSMSQNLAVQQGRRIDHHFMLVADLAESRWDWTQGEPPDNHADYYLRYNKTFSRMGGTLRYISIDNRDFFLALYHGLHEQA